MPLDPKQVEQLKGFYPCLSMLADGGVEFVLISPLMLPEGCSPASVDGLLCPTLRDNYSSRLFLSALVTHTGPGQNWNAAGVIIAGRKWWAVSWNTQAQNQTFLEMLLSHLRAFKK
ncbi:MAG TPA: hypothetical protein VH595_13335 [Verrucomicrobiae bacterium]|jgi:hypothetical protein|nr:hypothetical protein [Verrucomicrobiae bacterium]